MAETFSPINKSRVLPEQTALDQKPSFFNVKKRNESFDSFISNSLGFNARVIDSGELHHQFAEAKKTLKQIRLNKAQILILKAVNFCIKLFSSSFSQIDRMLLNNSFNQRVIKKYSAIIKLSDAKLHRAELSASQVPINKEQLSSLIATSIYELQKLKFEQTEQTLEEFKALLTNPSISQKQQVKKFNELPLYLQQALINLYEVEHQGEIQQNLKALINENHQLSAIDEVLSIFKEQIQSCAQLIENEKNRELEKKEEQKQELLFSHQQRSAILKTLFQKAPDASEMVYDISSERLLAKLYRNPKKKGPSAVSLEEPHLAESHLEKSLLDKPINVTMVGVEYAGFIKQGGLAEAIEGLSRGVKEQNEGNQVNLVFPKFSSLPQEVLSQLGEPQVHYSNRHEPYHVYSFEKDGVKCFFIEHPSFQLSAENPNIYGPDYESQATRFAAFSELAADLIYSDLKTDVIHLHDWHVAGVALKLKRQHRQEWEEGKIPPILFTFHNNNRSAQGRVMPGIYNYGPVIKGFQDAGIMDNNENLFVETLKAADAVTTVSETFGIESQQMAFGEGVSFAVKQAAKVGKLTGIINGTNPYRWDPETDSSLCKWKDIDSGEPLNLSYGADSLNLMDQKEECKRQLQKWSAKYLNLSQEQIDFSKPLVTYIGRFDSYQKGLDKFEEAIEATLKNGGQFICMGMGEDPEATRILDRLQNKYKKGVLFIRDYKDQNGRLYYQQGDSTRPGIGSLIRASSDFVFAPSRFEPCGLVQFEGWLFGSLAIGSKTGGLADTIIPLEKDRENFNGFLFQRGPGKKNRVIEMLQNTFFAELEEQKNSAGKVIARALDFWKQSSKEEKAQVTSRIIREGKKYGWTTSPKGFSPAEKYRFAYENAKSWSQLRRNASSQVNRIDALRARVFIGTKKPSIDLEEQYLTAYYSDQVDSRSLDKLYQQLPEGMRIQVPSPYGKLVDDKKHEKYGAFYDPNQTTFSVFAPKAKEVSVVCVADDETIAGIFPLEKEGEAWKVSVPDIAVGQKYYYRVNGKVKIDPYGRLHKPSATGKSHPYSVVTSSEHLWKDDEWMANRQNKGASQAMSIYEMHPSTWKKENGAPLNYRELALEIDKHCEKMGYTHVELMGILEHPDERSWGYQVTGYFAPNSRMGSVDDFKFMIDYLHQKKIGVILDWVPAHFAQDDFGLSNFDGSDFYEASGFKYQFSIRRRFFKYGSAHFDYRKKEVREFLISNASFWLKEMHLDGLRVDCLRSLLNSEDKESSSLFIRDFNAVVHNNHPGTVTIAEEFSGDSRVTGPYYKGGMAFDFKWHVGWMHHTLGYFSKPLQKRRDHYGQIKQAVMSDNFHRQVMFFSHDQVKDGVDTLINKTPSLSSDALKYANVRALLSWMMCLPGKKLHFMGAEFGNTTPWNQLIGQENGLLDSVDMADPKRQGLMAMMQALNHLYKSEKALHQFDSNGHDVKWIEDPKKVVHGYRRLSSEGDAVVCLHNFTGEPTEFSIVMPKKEGVPFTPIEIFNSDSASFNGSGKTNLAIKTEETEGGLKYTVQLAPLTTIIIKETA